MRWDSAELRDWLRQPGAWMIFVVGAVLSSFAWRALTLEVEHASRSSFNATVAESHNVIASRLRDYYLILQGLRGIFHVNPRVERAAFQQYVQSLLPVGDAGKVRSFSYAQRVPHALKKSYEATVRADTSVHASGYPGFAIKPPGERAEYMVLHLIEPFSGNEAGFGLDIAADPERRTLIELARDKEIVVATGGYALLSLPTAGPAVSLRLAVFRRGARIDSFESRRQAFAGVVSITFLVHDLVADAVSRHRAQAVQLRIVEAPAAVLYGSTAAPPEAGAFHATIPLEVGDRQWQLQFSAPQRTFHTAGDALMPWLALLAGLAITALLAGLIGSLTTSTQRAHRIARDFTEDLRRSQAELAETQRKTQLLIETLPNPVFFKDTGGRFLGVNKAWEAFFGTPRERIVGKTVHDMYPHAPEIGQRLDSMDQALWREPGTQTYEAEIVLADGSRRNTIYSKATFTAPDGHVEGLIGTITDFTERRNAETRQAMEHAVTQVLANADTLAKAAPRIIQTICETLGWACGAHWRWDEQAEVLRCAETWHVDAEEVAQYITTTFATINEAPAWRGEPPRTTTGGLIRRVWNLGVPVWIPDVIREPDFRRGADAAKAGLHCAFAFPVMAGAQPLGVMEFYGRHIAQPDAALLQIVHAMGSQIGQFTVRKQAEEKLRFVASHDALTGLPNRTMFTQRLEHAIIQARRYARRLAILFIDLDRFKLINDTLGHEAGDALLRTVAARLSENLRASDTVARLGGDEFVVLLEEFSEPTYVGGVAQKLIDALASPHILSGRDYHVSASIGVSTFPDDADSIQDLLKNADIAMYRAKEQGRNSFQFHSEQMNVHSAERLALESELRRALERSELVLHFQPQVAIRGGHVTGVEALLRWQHPARGLLAPAHFIGVAEESGLIVPIGEWVLRTACARGRAWSDSGFALRRIAVNLSARQFLLGDLPGVVARVLAETRCPRDILELEITESMVMDDPERAALLLQEIRRMGVKVAIDDFGTGYSSLGALKSFPIDNLKVDRSFIQDIPGNRDDAAITKAVIVMAHSLDMKVIAEGVETREQYEFLRANDCDEMQGYFFSKPVPEVELLALLRREAAAIRVS